MAPKPERPPVRKEPPKPKVKGPEAQTAVKQAGRQEQTQATNKARAGTAVRTERTTLKPDPNIEAKKEFVKKAIGNAPMSNKVYEEVQKFADAYPPEAQMADEIGRKLAENIKDQLRLKADAPSAGEAIEDILLLGKAYGSTETERQHYLGLAQNILENYEVTETVILAAAQSVGRNTIMGEQLVNQYSDLLIQEWSQTSGDMGQKIQVAYESGKEGNDDYILEAAAQIEMERQAVALEEKIKKDKKEQEEKDKEAEAKAAEEAAEKAAAETEAQEQAEAEAVEAEEPTTVQVGEGEAEVPEIPVEPVATQKQVVYEAKAEPQKVVRNIKEAVVVIQTYDPSLATEIGGLVGFINKKGDLSFRDLARLETAINQAPEEAKQALLRLYGEAIKSRMPDLEGAVREVVSASSQEKPDPEQVEHGMRLVQELAGRNTATDRLRQGMGEVLDQMESMPEWREPVTMEARAAQPPNNDIQWPDSDFPPKKEGAARLYIESMKRRLKTTPLGEDPQFWLREMNFVGGTQSPFTPTQQEILLGQLTQKYEMAIAIKKARGELRTPYHTIEEAKQDIEQFKQRQAEFDSELRLKQLERIQERLLTGDINSSLQDYIDFRDDIAQKIALAKQQVMAQREFGRAGVYTNFAEVTTDIRRYEELNKDLSLESRARTLDEIRNRLVWSRDEDIPHKHEDYQLWLNKIGQLEAVVQTEFTLRADRRTGLDRVGLDYVRANQKWIEHSQNIDCALEARDSKGQLRIKDETTRSHIRDGKKTFNAHELGRHIDAIQNRLENRPLLDDERKAVEAVVNKLTGKTSLDNQQLRKELNKIRRRLNKLTPAERKTVEDMLQQMTGQKIFKDEDIIRHLDVLQNRLISKQPVMQADEAKAISEVLQDMIRRKELFAHAYEPFIEAVKEYKRLGAEIHDILNEKDNNNIFILQNRKVREAINMALSAGTKAEGERYLGELDQLILAGLPGNENIRARRALRNLTRQLDLLQFIPQEGQMADYHMRQVGLKPEDISILEHLLNTEQLLNELMADPDKFLQMWDDSLKAINTIFRAADRLRHLPFDQSVTPLVEEPMFKQLANMILQARDSLDEYLKDGRGRDILVSVKFKEKGKWIVKPTRLSEGLTFLFDKIYADREVREFTHNARYILYTRGSVEDMAKFSSRIKTNTLEAAFFGEEDEAVYVAARFYERLMIKRLSDDTWIINPEFFQEKNGRIRLDEEVEKLMRQHFGDKLPPWKLERALAMGGGTATAITGSLVCWLATADAPRAGNFYNGYIGDSILGSIEYNRHHAFRWWVQSAVDYKHDAQGNVIDIDINPTNPIANLFFIQMQNSSLFKGWTPHQLMEEFKKHALDLKTGLNQRQDNMYQPFVEISNFFKVGPLMYREGWRYTGMLLHHFEMEGGAPQLLAEDFINWAKVDLEKTWDNISRAGSGALNWYIGAIKGAQEDGILNGKQIFGLQLSHDEDLAKKANKILKKRLTLEILGRNPLRFIFLDPTVPDRFSEDSESPNALRRKVLAKLQAIQSADPNRRLIKADIRSGSSDVERWELDSMVITETLMRHHVWSLEELQGQYPDVFQELRKRLGKLVAKDRNWGGRFPSSMPNRLDEAWEYWKAIQDEFVGQNAWNNWISNRDVQAVSDTSWLTTFIDQRLPYGFGTEDMDLTEVNWAGPGGSVVARAWGDMHRIVENAVLPMFNVDEILAEANASQSFEPLIKYLKQAGAAEFAVHGPPGKEEVVYGLSLFFIRYFDKDWKGQLPFGIGTLWGLRQMFKQSEGISLSRLDTSILGWAWDEGVTRAFIDQLVIHKLLPATEISKLVAEKQKHNANRLYDEAGARRKQVLVDTLRGALPYGIGLFALGLGGTALIGLKQEREEG